jgi:hypothetical protein
MKLLGVPWEMHDVRDAEAHARTLLDRKLAAWGARLSTTEYELALSYLLGIMWQLSGLAKDGPERRVYFVAGNAEGRSDEVFSLQLETFDFELGPFPQMHNAESELEAVTAKPYVLAAAIETRRPAGAYDPTLGLSFSTYSYRILSRRVVDWYRVHFHDSRYEPTDALDRSTSIEQLIAQREESEDAGGYLERRGPGARADFIDELHPNAYDDPTEEVLTRLAIGR